MPSSEATSRRYVRPAQAKLHDFIEQNSFGVLVSQVDGLGG
jgi:hypothetical protein